MSTLRIGEEDWAARTALALEGIEQQLERIAEYLDQRPIAQKEVLPDDALPLGVWYRRTYETGRVAHWHKTDKRFSTSSVSGAAWCKCGFRCSPWYSYEMSETQPTEGTWCTALRDKGTPRRVWRDIEEMMAARHVVAGVER